MVSRDLSKSVNPSSGVAAALEAAAFCGPVDEAFHIIAVLPGKMKKLAGREVGSFFSQERFKAPTHVWTLPRIEPIAPGRVPVILQCPEHFLRNGRLSPALVVKTLVAGKRRG